MSKIEPPRFLKRPCEECGYPLLEGWIAYASPEGFIYQYHCKKCGHVHFLSVPDIYKQKKERGKE